MVASESARERDKYMDGALASSSSAVARDGGDPGPEPDQRAALASKGSKSDDRLRNLTSRLARTAVGVREMSRELGG